VRNIYDILAPKAVGLDAVELKAHIEHLTSLAPSVRDAAGRTIAGGLTEDAASVVMEALKEFNFCLAYLMKSDGDASRMREAAAEALRAAVFILDVAPPDEETKARLIKKRYQETGRAGGLAKAQNAKEPVWWQHARAIYNSPKCPKKRQGRAAGFVENRLPEVYDFADKEVPCTRQITRVLFQTKPKKPGPPKRKKVGHPSS
jgi:hypothetical protein